MGTRQQGTLTQWDDAKGYGFITPDAGGGRLFVHARAFGLRAWRPYVGERLSYEPGRDAQGKARAQRVKALAPRRPQAASRGARAPAVQRPAPDAARGSAVLLLIPAFAALVLAVHLAWPLPHAVWGSYMALSLATFIVYAGDKRAARKGQWRVAESTLHGLALCCGWPGALLAQQLLAHKRSKPVFMRIFWGTVALNILAFIALFTPALMPWGRLLS